jgi:hypothetical protein
VRAAIGSPAQPEAVALRLLAERLAGVGARSALMAWQAGRNDGCRSALPHPPPLPLGAMVADAQAVSVLRESGDVRIEAVAGTSDAAWVPFGAFPHRDLTRLVTLLGRTANPSR